MQAADTSKDKVGPSSFKKPQRPGAKDLHVIETGLVVRATQGTTTCPGTEDWRVRGEQCQRLAEDCPRKRNPCAGETCPVKVPVGKSPGT